MTLEDVIAEALKEAGDWEHGETPTVAAAVRSFMGAGEIDAGLVERLREFRCANCGWEGALTDEAADAIEPLRAENARLREALVAIRQRGIERDVKWAGMNAHDIARAALSAAIGDIGGGRG